MKKDKAPESLPVSALLMPLPAFNSELNVNRADPDLPSREIQYNKATDDGLASTRSKHAVQPAPGDRDDDSFPPLPMGVGLSLRMAMAGQAENDQFPISSNQFGKQRR